MHRLRVILAAYSCLYHVSKAQPSLDMLASVWQPVDQAVYGAPSVTNSWGSLLVSTGNVLGFNALEMAPFSSGWDPENLYGWPIDSASLSIQGIPIPPAATLWTPYSVIRNATVPLSRHGGGTGSTVALSIVTEVRMVFEGQGVLVEANISIPDGTPTTPFSLTVDLSTTLRYYPRADACPSWHYPTHSVPCCWNWFPPEPAHGQEGEFISSWQGCTPSSSPSTASILISDTQSVGNVAYSFPGACGDGDGGGSNGWEVRHPTVGEAAQTPPPIRASPALASVRRSAQHSASTSPILYLGAPSSTFGTQGTWQVSLGGVGGPSTAVLRIAMVFSNASDTSSTVAAARAVADSFPTAWSDAQSDWQARFDGVFDPSHPHFSGHLPLVSTTPADEGAHASSFDALSSSSFTTTWPNGTFSSPMEHIYYHSIVSLLANERSNAPTVLPGGDVPCPVGGEAGLEAATYVTTLRSTPTCAYDVAPLASHGSSYRYGTKGGVARYMRPVPMSNASAQSCAMPSHTAAHGVPLIPGSTPSPYRIYLAGGGMNSSTNVFYWDNEYSAQLYALLDPQYITGQLPLWLGSLDPDSGIPSYWSFWGYDYASQRGIGNFYGANDMTLARLIVAYLRVTGDWEWLGTEFPVSYPNGTLVNTTNMYNVLLDLSTHWRDLVDDPPHHDHGHGQDHAERQQGQRGGAQGAGAGVLADYGGAPNLLECVPTYIHKVASLNAANSWMMNSAAVLAAHWANDTTTATRLSSDADAVAAAVLGQLYVPGQGYWLALYPNGTSATVRHVMDYVYVMLNLGLSGRAGAGGGQAQGYLPNSTTNEMTAFVHRELLVPHWMRALSLNDTAAPLSNRSDHGPSGAYIGWPALVVRAMGAHGAYADALAFASDTDFVAWLGPYGQATEIRPPGDPYKPMVFTLYNAQVAGSWADTILQTFFGLQPPLPTIPRQAADPLVDRDTPRGFTGVAKGLVWQGKTWDILSTPTGLQLQPGAN